MQTKNQAKAAISFGALKTASLARQLSFATLMLSITIIPHSLASDRAVEKLLNAKPVFNRSQIISAEEHAQIKAAEQQAQHLINKTQAGMVAIPKTWFLAGENKQKTQLKSAFKIDVSEVSNKAYQGFIKTIKPKASDKKTSFSHPEEPQGNDYIPKYWQEYRSAFFLQSPAAKVAPFDGETFKQDGFPVVGVDWWDAYAYCRWLGKRLPSALEWQLAARGTDGRLWPWGNQWQYNKANTGGDKWGEQDGYIYAAPVASFASGKSPYGVLNMAGNVAEWSSEGLILGGSSNNTPSAVQTTAQQKRSKNTRSFNIGFRCAQNG